MSNVTNLGNSGRYVPPGYLLFIRDRNLMAQRFDVSKPALVGEPAAVAEPAGRFSVSGQTSLAEEFPGQVGLD